MPPNVTNVQRLAESIAADRDVREANERLRNLSNTVSKEKQEQSKFIIDKINTCTTVMVRLRAKYLANLMDPDVAEAFGKFVKEFREKDFAESQNAAVLEGNRALKASKDANVALEDRVLSLEAELTRANGDLESARKDHADLETQVKLRATELDKANDSLNKAQKLNSESSVEMTRLLKDQETAAAERKELQTQLRAQNELEAHLNVFQERIDALSRSRITSTELIQELRDELESQESSSTRTITHLSRAFCSSVYEASTIRSQNWQLRVEVTNLQSNLQSCKADVERTKRELEKNVVACTKMRTRGLKMILAGMKFTHQLQKYINKSAIKHKQKEEILSRRRSVDLILLHGSDRVLGCLSVDDGYSGLRLPASNVNMIFTSKDGVVFYNHKGELYVAIEQLGVYWKVEGDLKAPVKWARQEGLLQRQSATFRASRAT